MLMKAREMDGSGSGSCLDVGDSLDLGHKEITMVTIGQKRVTNYVF